MTDTPHQTPQTESNIIQQLQSLRRRDPVAPAEVEEWVNRLTSLEDRIDHSRDTDPQLLTSKQAETLIRYYATPQGRTAAAEDMGMAPATFDKVRYAGEDTLLAAEAGLSIIDDLRAELTD